MTRARWTPFAGALASAVLLGLFTRVEAPFVPLGFVALVPWLLALDGAGVAVAVGSGAVAAAAFSAASFAWFPAAIAGYSGGSAAIAWALTLVGAPVLLAPHLLVFAGARAAAARLGASRAVIAAVGATSWIAAEWALPRVFADTLGYALYPWSSLCQVADLLGARGLTMILLIANECAAMAIASRRLRPVAMVAGPVVVAALCYGVVRGRQIAARTEAAPTFPAAVVQANITRYDKLAAMKGKLEAVADILQTHFQLSREVVETPPPPDLLVWPETVYPTTFGAPRTPEHAELDRAIEAMVAATSVPLVFGAFEREGEREFNAAFFLGPRADGTVGHDTYRKTNLFPLTEHVPGWLDAGWLRRALPWAGRWSPGPGPRVVRFALRGGAPIAVAPLICYEVTEAGYVAAEAGLGADLILTLSNDAWFTGPAGPRLHLLVAAFRSIETRLPQLRATNSGLSALILPTGEMQATTEFGSRAAFRVDVPRPPRSLTLVVAWGDWLGPASLIGLVALLAWIGLRRRDAASPDDVVPSPE
ncbi:MAG TPA: apolipoprotein N-acyltransferase [Kofleriaceae bacterium]|nr:apolipoprotein N-acyltransferase [Kofleriaceae bacterium]